MFYLSLRTFEHKLTLKRNRAATAVKHFSSFSSVLPQFYISSASTVNQPVYWYGTLRSVKIARGTSCCDTMGFFLFQMERNIIFLYLVMHEKHR